MRIAFYTLGCKLNRAETDELKENLQKEGFFIVGWGNRADIYVVHACSLTAGAEQGTRQIIRQAKRRNPKAKIFVTGCYKQKMPEVNYYTKNFQNILKKLKTIKSFNKAIDTQNTLPKNRTRVFIKIQTGCDNFCSYCIIPYLRGKPKSVSDRKIISAINKKVKKNFREIVLTGLNICKYNYHGKDLTDLIKKILNETKIQRIRFGSLDPSLVDEKFIALFRNQRVMPHIHLSLQSGSDRILKLMNRKYTAEKYLSLVKKIKKEFPLMGFTTDVIIGFPGETEKDFWSTCSLAKKVGFLKVHTFPFSPRPGTAAAKMTYQIDEKIKKERLRRLSKIAVTVREKLIKKMIGQTAPVLFEGRTDGTWLGYTPNYLRIKLPSVKNLKNKIINIKINNQNIDSSAT